MKTLLYILLSFTTFLALNSYSQESDQPQPANNTAIEKTQNISSVKAKKDKAPLPLNQLKTGSGISSDFMWQYFFAMTFFILIMFGGLVLVKKLNTQMRIKKGIKTNLECIGRLQIDSKNSVVLVRTDHEDLVIGCNQTHISLLTRYPLNEETSGFGRELENSLNSNQEV